MTDTNAPHAIGHCISGGYNVIAVSFEDDANAYLALTALKELDSQHQLEIDEAVVVLRDRNGEVVQKDEVGAFFPSGTVGVGFMGLLIGIIGGPLGVLIGGMSGMLLGSLFDVEDADETDSALCAISNSVRIGHTALLATLTEQSPEVVDVAMGKLGGSVL